ncbi:MAG TPA: hypothetical protein VF516_29890 [Kofleriaceae bacterium]
MGDVEEGAIPQGWFDSVRSETLATRRHRALPLDDAPREVQPAKQLGFDSVVRIDAGGNVCHAMCNHRPRAPIANDNPFYESPRSWI